MKTLIVEDDVTSRIIMEKIISPFGETHHAADGEEAMKIFLSAMDEGEPFDLICLDIMMPKMDGHQVLAAIRKAEAEKGIDKYDRTKIVMTTALEDHENRMKAFGERCDAYLVKPIDKEQMLVRLVGLGILK
jgi:two-component system, chemotaxis family, chemotaxis protein CheY